MKKMILPIAFAVASMPLTFAAQAPANPPASGTQTKPAATSTKKHKKAVKKSTVKSTPAASTGSGK